MSVLLQPLQLAAADGLLSHAIPMTSPECSTLRQQQGLAEPQAPSAACMEQGARYSGWSELLPCEMHRKQDKGRSYKMAAESHACPVDLPRCEGCFTPAPCRYVFKEYVSREAVLVLG